MNTPSSNASPVEAYGILKKSQIAVWVISPKHLRRTRSDIFSSEVGSYALVIINESPENMKKFNIWFYTIAKVKHTLEVSLSLLDDKHERCYTVEKRLSSSTSEIEKVCLTIDFCIVPHHSQKFFHNGVLKIHCCLDMPVRISTTPKPSNEFQLKFLLEKYLLNIEDGGVLNIKYIFTWLISANELQNKENEVRSDPFNFASSEFRFSKLQKSNQVCLSRETPNFFQQEIITTLAVEDNNGICHFTKEEVTHDSSNMFLNYFKVFENPYRFLAKGEVKICCSLQVDNSLKISSTENTADVYTNSTPAARELTSSPVNEQIQSKSIENHSQKFMAENATSSPKAEDKSELEEALNEMLELIHEARVDSSLPSSIISLLFSTAKEYCIPHLQGTLTKVLLNLIILNNHVQETALSIILRNIDAVSDTEQWLSFIKEQPELANIIVKRLKNPVC